MPKPDINTPIRMYIALKVLRAWNSGTAGFDGSAVVAVNGWIDDGMKGPVPWPDSPFFAEWAQKNGLSKIGAFIGYRFTAKLIPRGHSAIEKQLNSEQAAAKEANRMPDTSHTDPEIERLLNIARGCHDYGGGYHEPAEAEIFHHGIQTVINALEGAVREPDALQVRVLESIGRGDAG